MTAEACVLRAAAAYFGFETKVSSPGPACSIPFSPEISVSGDPFSKRAWSEAAIAESFMDIFGMVLPNFAVKPLLQAWGYKAPASFARLVKHSLSVLPRRRTDG